MVLPTVPCVQMEIVKLPSFGKKNSIFFNDTAFEYFEAIRVCYILAKFLSIETYYCISVKQTLLYRFLAQGNLFNLDYF